MLRCLRYNVSRHQVPGNYKLTRGCARGRHGRFASTSDKVPVLRLPPDSPTVECIVYLGREPPSKLLE